MKWCERCGGPRGRPLRELTVHGCRLCWIDLWTVRQVRWDAEEDAGDDQGYEDAMSVEFALTDGALDRDAANQPCPHASGWWLPEGARDNRFVAGGLGDEQRLFRWLAAHNVGVARGVDVG